jgi:hypothetical protein
MEENGMDIERAAIAAMQALLINRNEILDDVGGLTRRAVAYAVALEAALREHGETVELSGDRYAEYHGRIPTDDRLWQPTGNPESIDAE